MNWGKSKEKTPVILRLPSGGERLPRQSLAAWDQTMILLAFRHGLRASEVCGLELTQVDFAAATLAVTRAKHGTPSTHPLTGRELRALRRLHREAEGKSPFVFVSKRGSPTTVGNFQKLISRACEAAALKIKAHPNMLRHACGYKLANEGHDTRPAGVSDPSGRADPVNEARQKPFALRPSDAILRSHVFASSWLH
jgi:integrase